MPSSSLSGRAPAWTRDRRLISLGLVAGAAVGALIGRQTRQMTTDRPLPTMIDWEQARAIAINMNRGAALTATERARLDEQYRELVRRCLPVVAAYTGTELPPTLERTFAFDRVDWINANIEGFRRMFAPLEGLNPVSGRTKDGRTTVAALLWGGVNQRVVSSELGLLLGYLARRVLGQYDLALLGREPVATGKLYYVEPNIRQVEQTLGMPPADFRMWLALHETTHAFEFEAHPWLRDYFNGLLESYFEFLRQDAEALRTGGFQALRGIVARTRSDNRDDGSWIEGLMSPGQRALFLRMQATMCMVEGYSNHVMNVVGKELLPSYEVITRKFEQRQRERTMIDHLFARLTGLAVKMEQYRLGEAFINRIVAERGHDGVRRIWDGPEFLPTMEEIRAPERWLSRMDLRDSAQPALIAEGIG